MFMLQSAVYVRVSPAGNKEGGEKQQEKSSVLPQTSPTIPGAKGGEEEDTLYSIYFLNNVYFKFVLICFMLFLLCLICLN